MTRFNLISWNCMQLINDGAYKELKDIYQKIQDSKNPAIVCLQEARGQIRRDIISSTFSKMQSEDTIPEDNNRDNQGQFSAFTNDFELIDKVKIALPQLKKNLSSLPQAVLHKEMPKCSALLTRFRIPSLNEDIAIVNVHLDAFGTVEHKLSQVRVIKDVIDKMKDEIDHIVLCGDFNSTMLHKKLPEKIVQLFEDTIRPVNVDAHTSDIRNVVYPGIPLSKNKFIVEIVKKISLFEQKLDWVFVSSRIKPVDFKIDYNYKTSDHYPLFADLEIES